MKPILFSTQMIQAIRSGKKTQTRRPLKPQPPPRQKVFAKTGSVYDLWLTSGCWVVNGPVWCVHRQMAVESVFWAPRLNQGDTLWVRETWAVGDQGYIYRADAESKAPKWRPSIFMPKDACRLYLEVTKEPYPEAVDDISEEDAIADGFENKSAFLSYWQKLHAKRYPLVDDPWVWVVHFKIKEVR